MNQENYKQLALKWAPIHYQYTEIKSAKEEKDVSFHTKTDLLVPVNLDAFANPCKCRHRFKDHRDLKSSNTCTVELDDGVGKCACKEFVPVYENTLEKQEESWNTREMKDRLDKTNVEELVPVVYYSIATTSNYFFILYSFYHAYDEKHINDMEGCMIIIERNSKHEKIEGDKDRLVGMITVSHIFFPRYVYKKRIVFDENKFLETIKQYVPDKNNLEELENYKKWMKQIRKRFQILNIGGKMEADDEKDSTRALTQQETQGHGFYALGSPLIPVFDIKRRILKFLNRLDFIVYYPSSKAKNYSVDELLRYKGMPHTTSLYYELVDIHDDDGLCKRLNTEKIQSTFQKDGKFHGDKANPPWLWFEKNCGENLYFWHHPAELTETHFESKNQNKPFDNKYIKKMSQIEDGKDHICTKKL